MTKEEAIEKVREMKLSPGKDAELIIALHTLISELRESEDERIRKRLITLIRVLDSLFFTGNNPSKEQCIAYLEKQKEQKPIEMEVYEIGKGTTICGQDYKCKKDYKVGNCWYIKDVIYHCNRDGYLNDQNGVSWSCTPKWFNEYIYTNSELADEEKNDFVSGQFLQCKLSFDGFKEGEHYWLEYIGDDMYVGRSDNILNQKFHITPRQLYTLFSEQLEENEKEQNLNFDTHWENGSLVYEQKEQKPTHLSIEREYIEERLRRLIDKEGEYYRGAREELAHLFYILGGQPSQYLINNVAKEEQKPAEWSEEDDQLIGFIFDLLNDLAWRKDWAMSKEECLERLKSIRPQPKQEWSKEDEKMRVNILNALTPQLVYSVGKGTCTGTSTYKYDDEIKWLKSLRPVSKESLQPRWKPCEEQIHAIIEALKYLPNNKYEWMILNTLVDVFKKLM